MTEKLQEKSNKSEFSSERKRIDTEEAKKSERLNAISKKKEERLLEVKRDLEEKLRRRLIVKNSDLKKKAKEQERKFRNQKKSFSEKQMTQIRNEMKEIMKSGIESVRGEKIIAEKVKFDGNDKLTIGKVKYKLKNNVHMIGWGMETAIIGVAFEKLIGEQMKKGFLIVSKKEISSINYYKSLQFDTMITYFEVDDHREIIEANKMIFEYCKKLKKTDILVVILSAGTNDLLCLPRGNIGVKEKIHFLREMKNANATKEEINIIRKKLSLIRGSGLARIAFPAKVITIIMSDVPGDNINEIAGAPTVNESWTNEVNAILHKYHSLTINLSLSMRQVLNEISPSMPKKMLSKSGNFKFVDYHIIASNVDAMDSMAKAAFKLGYIPIKVNSKCVGTSQKMSHDKVREIFPSKEKWGFGLYLILGGRGSVNVADAQWQGQGGPNQELALYFSIYWYLKCRQYPILNDYNVWFLGCASSGKDGNSHVAGAFGYKTLVSGVCEKFHEFCNLHLEAKLMMMDLDPNNKENEEFIQLMENLSNEIRKVEKILPHEILSKNNTNFFFNNINDGEEILKIDNETDSIFTNVRDLHLIRIVRYQCNCDGSCFYNRTQIPQNSTISNQNLNKKYPCCGKIGSPKESNF
ncbi:glycerate kinase-like isoform X2 [Leptopilina boulardi]|uniref:glycerate kinase-like isoform X2 n=1 Tax=Leptopilina boulardi TaxID=63433 RepID=UPI0021F644F9|nr:glycerate kinase-like isoform X2 [Leptopilina boulardi]